MPKPLASGGSARFRHKQNEVVSMPAARCKCLRCFLYGNWGCPQPVGTSPPGPRSTPGRASASAQVPPPASTRSPRRKARTHAHTRGPSFQMLTSSHHQIESPSVTPACTKMLPGHPLPDHRYRRDRLPETDTLTRLQVRCSSTSDFIHAFHGILTLQERWRLLP